MIIKRTIFFFLLTFLYLIYGIINVYGGPGADKVKIIHLKGEVGFIRGNEEMQRLTKEVSLGEQDVIETKEKSLAIISYGGNTVKIGENSQFKINSLASLKNKRKDSYVLKYGRAIFKYLGRKNDKKLEVRTKNVALGVRGTTFFVFSSSGNTNMGGFAVKEGAIEIENYLSKKKVTLKDGEGILLNDKGKFSQVKNYDWIKLINWELDPQKKDLSDSPKLIDAIKNEEFLKGGDLSDSEASVKQIFQKECNNNDYDACAYLAFEDKKDTRPYLKACSGGSAFGCFGLGNSIALNSYQDMDKFDKNFEETFFKQWPMKESKSDKKLTETCYLGQPKACYLIGKLKAKGDSRELQELIKKIQEKTGFNESVVKILSRYCSKNYGEACASYSKFIQSNKIGGDSLQSISTADELSVEKTSESVLKDISGELKSDDKCFYVKSPLLFDSVRDKKAYCYGEFTCKSGVEGITVCPAKNRRCPTARDCAKSQAVSIAMAEEANCDYTGKPIIFKDVGNKQGLCYATAKCKSLDGHGENSEFDVACPSYHDRCPDADSCVQSKEVVIDIPVNIKQLKVVK